jgi:hypothetical protein
MDKKAKKKIEILQQRLQKLRLQLAGAKQQADEPDEVQRIEQEIAKTLAEIERLKSS